MLRRGRCMVAGFLCLALVLVVTMTPTMSVAARKVLIAGTGPAGSSVFPFMVAATTLANKYAPELALSPQESGGSVAAVRMLESGDIDMGSISTNAANRAVRGRAPFDKKYPVQVLFNMFLQKFVYIGLKSADVKSWHDVKGKRMILGAPGGSTRIVGEMLAKLHGLDKTNFKPSFLRWAAQTNALRDKLADGGYGLIQGAGPNAPTMEVATTLEVNLFGVDEEIIKKAVALEPGIYRTEIQANRIPNQPEPIVTVGELLTISTAEGRLTEREAYLITKVVMEHHKSLVKYTPLAAGYTPELAVRGIQESGLKFHPGALRYYKEKGLVK